MCNMKCSECEICVHMYMCNCTDFLILSTMCKHIHLVQRSLAEPHSQSQPMGDEDTRHADSAKEKEDELAFLKTCVQGVSH